MKGWSAVIFSILCVILEIHGKLVTKTFTTFPASLQDLMDPENEFTSQKLDSE